MRWRLRCPPESAPNWEPEHGNEHHDPTQRHQLARLLAEPWESLRAVLRDAGCVSVRFGSDTGETGAAAVLLDGRLVSADVVLGDAGRRPRGHAPSNR